MEKETEKNNILISEFMNNGSGSRIWTSDGMGGRISYNNSWDWLMPVVEKIDSLDATATNITNICCEIYSKCFQHTNQSIETLKIQKIAKPKINAVWLAVVAFIKWHNEQINK